MIVTKEELSSAYVGREACSNRFATEQNIAISIASECETPPTPGLPARLACANYSSHGCGKGGLFAPYTLSTAMRMAVFKSPSSARSLNRAGSLSNLRFGLQIPNARNVKRIRQLLVPLQRHGVEQQIGGGAVARNAENKMMLAFVQTRGPSGIPGNVRRGIDITGQVFVRVESLVLLERCFLAVNGQTELVCRFPRVGRHAYVIVAAFRHACCELKLGFVSARSSFQKFVTVGATFARLPLEILDCSRFIRREDDGICRLHRCQWINRCEEGLNLFVREIVVIFGKKLASGVVDGQVGKKSARYVPRVSGVFALDDGHSRIGRQVESTSQIDYDFAVARAQAIGQLGPFPTAEPVVIHHAEILCALEIEKQDGKHGPVGVLDGEIRRFGAAVEADGRSGGGGGGCVVEPAVNQRSGWVKALSPRIFILEFVVLRVKALAGSDLRQEILADFFPRPGGGFRCVGKNRVVGPSVRIKIVPDRIDGIELKIIVAGDLANGLFGRQSIRSGFTHEVQLQASPQRSSPLQTIGHVGIDVDIKFAVAGGASQGSGAIQRANHSGNPVRKIGLSSFIPG